MAEPRPDSEPAEAVPPSAIIRIGQLATLLGVLMLVALLVFGLTTRASDESINQGLADGEPVPAPLFDLEVLDSGAMPPELESAMATAAADDRLQLAELSGLPIVLNFWASWCNPCRAEAPVLQGGWERWGPEGVLFLGLDTQDLSDDALDFVEEFAIDYPTIREPDKTVASDYGLTGIPETFFIDARGRVVAHSVGAVSAEQLDSGVKAALAGRVDGIYTGGEQKPQR